MPTSTIAEALTEVLASAATKSSPETRVVTEDMLQIGKVMRQGDVYLRRLPLDHVFDGLNKTAMDSRQLAPGDTQGSRHIVERPSSAKLFARSTKDPLKGPVIVAPEGFYLSHPTHADIDCRVPGCYEVTYPRDFTAEEIARRAD